MLTNPQLLKVLDHYYGGPDLPRPATLFVGLSTTVPNLLTGANFTEPANGYARQSIDNNTFWGPAAIASSGTYNGFALKPNVAEVLFDEATGSWGTPSHAGLFDAVSGGVPTAILLVTSPAAVSAGMQVRFPPGRLSLVTRRV